MTDSNDSQPPSKVSKRKAFGKDLDHSHFLLHDTGRKRISGHVWFVTRSTGKVEVSLKLESEDPAALFMDPPDPKAAQPVEISLNAKATQALYVELKKHLQISEKDEGSYLLIPIEPGGGLNLGNTDHTAVAGAFAAMLRDRTMLEQLGDKDPVPEIVKALKGAARIKELKTALLELRDLLNRGETKEGTYQAWFESHGWAFGTSYVSSNEVRRISESDDVDFLVKSVTSGFRDVIELKRPDMNILNFDSSHQTHYFSADASKAIGQCHRYLDVLHDRCRNGLYNHPEVVAYHPRATIVIGRSNDWDHRRLKDLHGLNQRLHGITVMSFDQLLLHGERLVDVLASESSDVSSSKPLDPEDWSWLE